MPLIPLILKFLKDNWFPITITFFIVSIWIYIQLLKNEILELENIIIKRDAEITACKTSIDERNNAIKMWADKTKSQKIELEKLNNEISKISNITNKQIQLILNQKAPETCEETIKYFIDMGKKYE